MTFGERPVRGAAPEALSALVGPAVSVRKPAAAATLLGDLVGQALGSECEHVVRSEAPDAVEVPSSLVRTDGRSVCQHHGA
jgi:hypothetical protein